MADDYTLPVDVRIYGATPPKPLGLGDSPLAAPVPEYTPPVGVPAASIMNGSPLLAEGVARLKANNRERSNIVEAAGGAMSQWLPQHFYEFLTTPNFAWDKDHQPAEWMRNNVKSPLSLLDSEFMLKAKSAADSQHRYDTIQTRNEAHVAMGDHSTAAFIAGALDPTFIAIDVASMGTARMLQAGRMTAAATAVGLTTGAGLVEQQVTPTSNTQIVLMAAAMGAGSGLFYRNGKMAPKDPGYPAAELGDVVKRIDQPEVGGLVDDIADPLAVPKGPALTESRVPAGSPNRTPVTYEGGTSGGEYNPAVTLSRSEQAALHADGRVFTVETIEDIATHAESVRTGRTVIEADAKAVYLPGDDKVFLITKNLKPGDDVKGIMLHEYGVHMNAERVLGSKVMAEMLDTLEDMALAGNKRAKAAFDDVPHNTPQHLLREEALGYYVERNHKIIGDSIVSRFVAGARALLRKAGMGGLKLSENDIMQLVRQAAKGGAKAEKSSFDLTFPNVWHGSPVKGFDALKTEFMGTGEGAQAFGWGHYLTSEKGTALSYRNKEAVRRGKAADEGGLYKVQIKATAEDFINLDARVQSPQVAAAFAKLGVRDGVTGKTAYDYLARTLGGQKAASEALYAEGVAGNRYATGRTRMRDVQSSNYVLFNDALVDVTARYSKGIGGSTKDAVKTVMNSKEVAKMVEWSWHKTFGKFSVRAQEVADMFLDSPTAMSGNSAASIQRALRADMSSLQYAYEDLLLGAMASKGFGLKERIFKTTAAIKAQQGIEKDVVREMLRRDRSAKDGIPHSSIGVDPAIAAMADSLDALSTRALTEMKAAGVLGADLVSESAGYFTRRWDIGKLEAIAAKLEAHGPMPAGVVRQTIVDTISIGIQRANGWDAQVAGDVAGAIYDRTMRKGLFQDNEFFAGMGADTTGQLRNLLSAEGMSGARLQRVLDVLEGKADDAGKMPVLKQRVDMHMDESLMLPDGTSVTIMDMLDTNLASITERYLDATTARAAMARKGLKSPTELTTLRTQLAESIPDLPQRALAMESFDQMLNVLQGLPVGEKMLKSMRDIQAVTQMVGLASSGLWQLTEYSTIMAQHGAGRVMKEMFKELPFVRDMVKHEATSLREVLARNSSQDTRLRPFINRMEDNFEIPMSESVSLALMQAKQLVPYANAMKFIQRHQARTTANLIVDTIQRGAKGDAKALAALEVYGLESGSMTKVGADIRAHGMDTAKWSDATWQEVRGPLTKMMDEAVLRARLGEMPQFAHTSTVGKFLFTFRSFVLAAHNKVLANTLANGGYAGMGLLLMHQLPLTVLATWANTGLQGKEQEDLEGTIKKALGQVGAFGLFSELFGVMTGNKQQFGTPGLIGPDRMYKVVSAISSGNAGDSAAALLNATPVLSAILPVRAISEALKDKTPAPQD